MSGSSFSGDLNMGGLQVEGSLYMHNIEFVEDSKSTPILTLTATNVRGDVKYGTIKPPKQVGIVGFSYERILSGGMKETASGRWVDSPIDWQVLYRDLLSLQVPYSPQPYEHLASVLRRMGDAETAISVLHESARRDLAIRSGFDWSPGVSVPKMLLVFIPFIESIYLYTVGKRRFMIALATLSFVFYFYNAEFLSWVGVLTRHLYGLLVGFGYYPQSAILWVAGFTVLGALVLRSSPKARAKGWPWCLGASLDHLLPIVELNKEFSDFFDDPARERLTGWQLFYFAFHASVGFMLASFVVAGLAGLTQAR